MNIFLFIHFIIALLLIAVIMLQKTNVDGVSTLSGSNMGLMNIASTNSFLVRTTYILAFLFILNSIILANLSSSYRAKSNKIHTPISEEIQKSSEKSHNDHNHEKQGHHSVPVK